MGALVPSPKLLQQELFSSLEHGEDAEGRDSLSGWRMGFPSKANSAVGVGRGVGTEDTDYPNGSQGLMINLATPVATSWVPGSCVPPTGDIAAYKDLLFKMHIVPQRMVCIHVKWHL